MSEMAKELQSQSQSQLNVIKLFTKCLNGKFEVGNNRDCFLPISSSNSPERLSQYRFVGQIMGISALSKKYLSFHFPPLFWKLLVWFFY